MKKESKQINNYTQNVFVTLVDMWDVLSTSRQYRSLEDRNIAHDYARHKDYFDKQKRNRAIANLKKKKWIESRKKGESIEYKLTEEGLKAAIKLDAYYTTKLLKDGKKCFVFFDFPVAANKARDEFRYTLKQCGFKLCQQSIWVSNKNIGPQIAYLAKALDASEWVRVVVGKEID